MVNENIELDETSLQIRRECDELTALFDAIKQQIQSIEGLEIFQRINESRGGGGGGLHLL